MDALQGALTIKITLFWLKTPNNLSSYDWYKMCLAILMALDLKTTYRYLHHGFYVTTQNVVT